jgi:hypothetical protein
LLQHAAGKEFEACRPELHHALDGTADCGGDSTISPKDSLNKLPSVAPFS